MSHEHAPAVEALIHTYPKYITVEALPVDGDDEKVRLVVQRGCIYLCLFLYHTNTHTHTHTHCLGVWCV